MWNKSGYAKLLLGGAVYLYGIQMGSDGPHIYHGYGDEGPLAYLRTFRTGAPSPKVGSPHIHTTLLPMQEKLKPTHNHQKGAKTRSYNTNTTVWNV